MAIEKCSLLHRLRNSYMITKIKTSRLSMSSFALVASAMMFNASISLATVTHVGASEEVVAKSVNALPVDDTKQQLRMLLQNFTSFEANFSQSISDEEGEELQQSAGIIVLSAPNKLRWETSVPDETLLIADGQSVWNIDPFVEQVTVLKQSAVTANNPLMLLVSDDLSQWDLVTVRKIDDVFIIESLDDTANIARLDVTFTDATLSRLVSYDRQLQKSLLIFSDVRQNQSVSESHFQFDVPSTFIVDDQRDPSNS